jgi:hypothetical protein
VFYRFRASWFQIALFIPCWDARPSDFAGLENGFHRSVTLCPSVRAQNTARAAFPVARTGPFAGPLLIRPVRASTLKDPQMDRRGAWSAFVEGVEDGAG